MIIKENTKQFIVFDLDDTLYFEFDFLKSAFSYISRKLEYKNADFLYMEMIGQYRQGKNVFENLVKRYPNVNKDLLITLYRDHEPNIKLLPHVKDFLIALNTLNIPIGLLTDGRSKTQRNKIMALKIGSYFNEVLISEEFGSEKPNIENYKYFENKYPGFQFTYVADNISKDFISPNKLNWDSWCLIDNGMNIHPQSFIQNEIGKDYLPKNFFRDYSELL